MSAAEHADRSTGPWGLAWDAVELRPRTPERARLTTWLALRVGTDMAGELVRLAHQRNPFAWSRR